MCYLCWTRVIVFIPLYLRPVFIIVYFIRVAVHKIIKKSPLDNAVFLLQFPVRIILIVYSLIFPINATATSYFTCIVKVIFIDNVFYPSSLCIKDVFSGF